jgi:hypothetical protein
MACDPRLHGLGLLQTVVIHDPSEAGDPWSGIGVLQE